MSSTHKINYNTNTDIYYKILQKIINEENTPENTSENTPENTPENTSENTPENTPENEDEMAFIDVPNYLERPFFTQEKPILICMFQIKMESLFPFLLFLLEKINNVYNFTRFPSFDGGKNYAFLKKEVVLYLENKFKNSIISYVGFTETATHNIIIMKCNKENEDANIKLPSDDYCWATTHEIMNLKKVIHTSISPVVNDFFLQHPSLLYLKNDNNTRYETPVIGYYKPRNMPHYCVTTDMRCIFREKKHNEIGKCYYFYIDVPTINSNDIIIRVLIFLGRTSLKIASGAHDKYDSFLFTTTDKIQMYAIPHSSHYFVL